MARVQKRLVNNLRSGEVYEPYETQERAITRKEVERVYKDSYYQGENRDRRAYERIENPYDAFYCGLDPRRRQEMADGGIIQEDRKATANLPQQAIHHEYPQAGYYTTPYLDSTRRGLEKDYRSYDNTLIKIVLE